MRGTNPQEMARWLRQRERAGWSWVQLSAWSGHPVWKLRYWQRRLEGGGRTSQRHARAFVAVEVTPLPGIPGAPIEITTPAGYRVQVPRDFDVEHLRRVLEALEHRC